MKPYEDIDIFLVTLSRVKRLAPNESASNFNFWVTNSRTLLSLALFELTQGDLCLALDSVTKTKTIWWLSKTTSNPWKQELPIIISKRGRKTRRNWWQEQNKVELQAKLLVVNEKRRMRFFVLFVDCDNTANPISIHYLFFSFLSGSDHLVKPSFLSSEALFFRQIEWVKHHFQRYRL